MVNADPDVVDWSFFVAFIVTYKPTAHVVRLYKYK